MDQVRPDQQLGLAICEAAHSMRVPDFFEEILSHGFAGVQVSTGCVWRRKKTALTQVYRLINFSCPLKQLFNIY